MSRRFLHAATFGFVLILCRPAASPAQLAADWVLLNGKVLTADSEDPANFTVAEAVAIYDGKFVVVGTNQAALAAAGPNTRRVDLGGRTMLPGLVETHIHVHNHTLQHQLRNEILPSMTDRTIDWKSKEEGLEQLRALARSKAAGEWIVVPVTGEGDLDEGDELAGAPSLAELDQAFPDRPVSLILFDRFAIVNSRALNLLLERYPQGVPEVVRGADGRPTGFLRNAASRAMEEFYPALTPGRVEELAPFYRKELEEPAARGVTTLSSRMDSGVAAHVPASGQAWGNARADGVRRSVGHVPPVGGYDFLRGSAIGRDGAPVVVERRHFSRPAGPRRTDRVFAQAVSRK
jgi:predicted amidohydrolase YtcJ